mgnify:FL=1
MQKITDNVRVIDKAVNEILHAASEQPASNRRSCLDTETARQLSLPHKIQSGRYTSEDLNISNTDYTDLQYYEYMAKLSLVSRYITIKRKLLEP